MSGFENERDLKAYLLDVEQRDSFSRANIPQMRGALAYVRRRKGSDELDRLLSTFRDAIYRSGPEGRKEFREVIEEMQCAIKEREEELKVLRSDVAFLAKASAHPLVNGKILIRADRELGALEMLAREYLVDGLPSTLPSVAEATAMHMSKPPAPGSSGVYSDWGLTSTVAVYFLHNNVLHLALDDEVGSEYNILLSRPAEGIRSFVANGCWLLEDDDPHISAILSRASARNRIVSVPSELDLVIQQKDFRNNPYFRALVWGSESYFVEFLEARDVPEFRLLFPEPEAVEDRLSSGIVAVMGVGMSLDHNINLQVKLNNFGLTYRVARYIPPELRK